MPLFSNTFYDHNFHVQPTKAFMKTTFVEALNTLNYAGLAILDESSQAPANSVEVFQQQRFELGRDLMISAAQLNDQQAQDYLYKVYRNGVWTTKHGNVPEAVCHCATCYAKMLMNELRHKDLNKNSQELLDWYSNVREDNQIIFFLVYNLLDFLLSDCPKSIQQNHFIKMLSKDFQASALDQPDTFDNLFKQCSMEDKQKICLVFSAGYIADFIMHRNDENYFRAAKFSQIYRAKPLQFNDEGIRAARCRYHQLHASLAELASGDNVEVLYNQALGLIPNHYQGRVAINENLIPMSISELKKIFIKFAASNPILLGELRVMYHDNLAPIKTLLSTEIYKNFLTARISYLQQQKAKRQARKVICEEATGIIKDLQDIIADYEAPPLLAKDKEELALLSAELKYIYDREQDTSDLSVGVHSLFAQPKNDQAEAVKAATIPRFNT